MNQEMEGRFYRFEYWSDDCPEHPRGSQIMWHVSMAGAIAESAESMGRVGFPGGLGRHYDHVNVVPDGYVHEPVG